ncbi:hypothetical protein Q1695_002269 [Nippostrongylus brasiliensis]|nr:hypothetical protein Q1695_002269 [Nippostrongylus brasiliensis]
MEASRTAPKSTEPFSGWRMSIDYGSFLHRVFGDVLSSVKCALFVSRRAVATRRPAGAVREDFRLGSARREAPEATTTPNRPSRRAKTAKLGLY